MCQIASPPPLLFTGCPQEILASPFSCREVELEQGDGAGLGKEPVMVYFGNGGKQEREGKSRLCLLHLSEHLHAQSGRMNPGKPMVSQPLTTPCLLLRTNALLTGLLGCLWLCPPAGMGLLVLSHHGAVMALGFPKLLVKCRAEDCPTVHPPCTNSSDTCCPLLLLLHLDVALSINPTSVMPSIFKTKII